MNQGCEKTKKIVGLVVSLFFVSGAVEAAGCEAIKKQYECCQNDEKRGGIAQFGHDVYGSECSSDFKINCTVLYGRYKACLNSGGGASSAVSTVSSAISNQVQGAISSVGNPEQMVKGVIDGVDPSGLVNKAISAVGNPADMVKGVIGSVDPSGLVNKAMSAVGNPADLVKGMIPGGDPSALVKGALSSVGNPADLVKGMIPGGDPSALVKSAFSSVGNPADMVKGMIPGGGVAGMAGEALSGMSGNLPGMAGGAMSAMGGSAQMAKSLGGGMGEGAKSLGSMAGGGAGVEAMGSALGGAGEGMGGLGKKKGKKKGAPAPKGVGCAWAPKVIPPDDYCRGEKTEGSFCTGEPMIAKEKDYIAQLGATEFRCEVDRFQKEVLDQIHHDNQSNPEYLVEEGIKQLRIHNQCLSNICYTIFNKCLAVPGARKSDIQRQLNWCWTQKGKLLDLEKEKLRYVVTDNQARKERSLLDEKFVAVRERFRMHIHERMNNFLVHMKKFESKVNKLIRWPKVQ